MMEIQAKTGGSEADALLGIGLRPTSSLPDIQGEGARSASWNPKAHGGRLLYKEWEEKFKQQSEAQTLEERKKKLEEIRAMKKPTTKEELEEHARKYEELREEKRQKHLEELQKKHQ